MPAATSAAPAPSAAAGCGCDIEKAGDCEKACLDGVTLPACVEGKVTVCGAADSLVRKAPQGDNPELRVRLNIKGCESGDGKSCSRLGTQYKNGDGAAKAPAKALEYYELACKKDYGNGCWFAGGLYADPTADRPQDLTKAAELYSKGCTLGDKNSCESKADLEKGTVPSVATLDDLVAAPDRHEGKHVWLKNVAVRRASPTSGAVFKPGGSPSVDGIPAIMADGREEARRKWLALPAPIKGVQVNFVEAIVEKQVARDARVRLVIVDLGEVVP